MWVFTSTITRFSIFFISQKLFSFLSFLLDAVLSVLTHIMQKEPFWSLNQQLIWRERVKISIGGSSIALLKNINFWHNLSRCSCEPLQEISIITAHFLACIIWVCLIVVTPIPHWIVSWAHRLRSEFILDMLQFHWNNRFSRLQKGFCHV